MKITAICDDTDTSLMLRLAGIEIVTDVDENTNLTVQLGESCKILIFDEEANEETNVTLRRK